MTHEELLQTFVYEPETGTLRKIKNARKPYPWRGAGKDRRYLITTIDGEHIYLHRLVWFYHHGRMPTMVDHINGNTRDNRIENLRECTAAQNQYNSSKKRNNAAGHKGVVFHRNCQSRPWQAKIAKAGRVFSLGYYATKEEAADAYAAGAIKHAGEFARIG